MAFSQYLGRLLFSAIFILSAWQKVQDFGSDGGPALKKMRPKMNKFRGRVENTLNFKLPPVQDKALLQTAMALEGVGALLFITGSELGAYMLLIFLATVTPIMHNFYDYNPGSDTFQLEFVHFLKNLSMFGALVFFLGMKAGRRKRGSRDEKKSNSDKKTK